MQRQKCCLRFSSQSSENACSGKHCLVRANTGGINISNFGIALLLWRVRRISCTDISPRNIILHHEFLKSQFLDISGDWEEAGYTSLNLMDEGTPSKIIGIQNRQGNGLFSKFLFQSDRLALIPILNRLGVNFPIISLGRIDV